jgi:type I restriction enzyme S subunit
MSADWPVMSLKEANVSLIDCVHKTPPAADSGYPYVAIPQMKSGRIDISDARKISKEHLEEWTKKAKPVFNDVILSRRCNPGETAFVERGLQCALGQNLVLLRADGTKVYLRWLMRSPEWWGQVEKFINAGAVFDSLKCADIPNFQLTIPPVENQKDIADFLRALDDKIELNRQINQTLEQIAQTIFKSWFVDFEPVKAKIEAKAAGRDPERAAMCAISGKIEPDLDQLPPEQYQQLAATAALFPDELVESELGLIPVGWEVKSISDISKFATGKVDVSALCIENYISTENMAENRGGVSHAASLPTVSIVPSFSKGQILISNIRPYFKKIWVARFDGGRSNDVLAFDSTEKDCIEFLYNLLFQDEFFEFMMRTSKGAKMPRGDKGAIAGWKFPCAGHSLRSFFAEKVRPYYSHIESLNTEVQHLALIRDTLLPKLLSGELRPPSVPPIL